MRIALIHGKYFNSWEALGLAYIASFLRKHKPEIEFIFFQGCFDSEETIAKESAKSDIICFSCTTPTFPWLVRVGEAIKMINPKARIVVGGYHPSAVPSECLKFKAIDQVVVGEGESAMLDIVNGNTDKIVLGKMLNFSELFWPDRKLIRNERNIQVAYNDNKKRITSFQGHRGCPFKCCYCADGNRIMCGKQKLVIRHRDVSDLLNEMEYVTKEFNLDLLKFCDATWNISIKWIIDFCKEKIERKFNIPFYPNIHPGVCSEEMFVAMAEANCFEIAIGVESGSEKILKQIGKGTNRESIRRCVNLAKKARLKIRGYFILGMPEEDENDISETEKFAEELDLNEYGFTILCPWPGTQMYHPKTYANINWEKTDEYSNDFWRTKYLTNEQLKKWQKRLTERFSNRLTWHNEALQKKK